jgi:hypothetical protein
LPCRWGLAALCPQRDWAHQTGTAQSRLALQLLLLLLCGLLLLLLLHCGLHLQLLLLGGLRLLLLLLNPSRDSHIHSAD